MSVIVVSWKIHYLEIKIRHTTSNLKCALVEKGMKSKKTCSKKIKMDEKEERRFFFVNHNLCHKFIGKPFKSIMVKHIEILDL